MALRDVTAGAVAGYVMAGGESSRMQCADLPQDKALLCLSGQTLLDRALATLAEVCPEPRILCGTSERCARLRPHGHTVPDQVPLAGPLGGLHAALLDAEHRGAAWALLLPVDLPWMSALLLRAFVHQALSEGAAAACMRVHTTVQPLPVLVRVDIAPTLAAALRSGERKLLSGLQSIGLQAMDRRSGNPGLCLVEVGSLPYLRGRRSSVFGI